MKYDLLVRARILRKKNPDIFKIRSLVNSAIEDSSVALNIPLNEKTSTVIFRELYESIRQLGEARWNLLGYEPLNHEISLDGLKELDLKNKLQLNFLERFKKIRNDANYRGFRVTVNQSKEIISFWSECGKEAGEILRKLIK